MFWAVLWVGGGPRAMLTSLSLLLTAHYQQNQFHAAFSVSPHTGKAECGIKYRLANQTDAGWSLSSVTCRWGASANHFSLQTSFGTTMLMEKVIELELILCGLHVRTQSCPILCDSMVAPQAPLTMGLSRQEYWSGLPFLMHLFFGLQQWLFLTELKFMKDTAWI